MIVRRSVGEAPSVMKWLTLTRATPEEGADAGEELLEGERLDEIVVGPEIQPGHLVSHGVPGGEHEDRRSDAAFARGPEDPEAVAARQQDVEHDQVVGLTLEEQVERNDAIGSGLHRVPLFLEPLPDEARDLPVVLDDKNAHGRARPILLDPLRDEVWQVGP